MAAGQGTRMASSGPKVLQELCGRPMLGYVVDQALALEPSRVLVVVGHESDQVEAYLQVLKVETGAGERIGSVVQTERLGTGHAVLTCSAELEALGTEADAGPIVVLSGDMPLFRVETLRSLVDAWYEQAAAGAGAVILTSEPDDARGFGRVMRAGEAVQGVVEEKDASPEQRLVREVNVGVYAFSRATLLEGLPRLSSNNAQGEYYLTDMVGLLVGDGRPVSAQKVADFNEVIGVNTLKHLSEARTELQWRILEGHLAAGVRIEDPATTYIDHGVEIGHGTRILPCTVIRAGVSIGEECEVGPFTHLRVGTRLDDHAEVGNFTEVKKSTVGSHTKAKHLSYLGDVTIGAGANIGAGTIVANYDGTHKHPTQIGDRAFIGSGSILIAPCTIGEGALTGAGAVLRRGTEVGPDESWVGVPARKLEPKRDSND
ncbi:MAG: NTP transferase domain-containing protein [Planctomycetota bacterium]|nr:NTP transferase domain-containing protein [Planctomycetota bacterium]